MRMRVHIEGEALATVQGLEVRMGSRSSWRISARSLYGRCARYAWIPIGDISAMSPPIVRLEFNSMIVGKR